MSLAVLDVGQVTGAVWKRCAEIDDCARVQFNHRALRAKVCPAWMVTIGVMRIARSRRR